MARNSNKAQSLDVLKDDRFKNLRACSKQIERGCTSFWDFIENTLWGIEREEKSLSSVRNQTHNLWSFAGTSSTSLLQLLPKVRGTWSVPYLAISRSISCSNWTTDAEVAGYRDVVHHRPKILDSAKPVDLIKEKHFQISAASTRDLNLVLLAAPQPFGWLEHRTKNLL